MLRSRRDIENVDKQLVQLLVFVSAASTAEADRAALHTTVSGVPNEHVSRLRQ